MSRNVIIAEFLLDRNNNRYGLGPRLKAVYRQFLFDALCQGSHMLSYSTPDLRLICAGTLTKAIAVALSELVAMGRVISWERKGENWIIKLNEDISLAWVQEEVIA